MPSSCVRSRVLRMNFIWAEVRVVAPRVELRWEFCFQGLSSLMLIGGEMKEFSFLRLRLALGDTSLGFGSWIKLPANFLREPKIFFRSDSEQVVKSGLFRIFILEGLTTPLLALAGDPLYPLPTFARNWLLFACLSLRPGSVDSVIMLSTLSYEASRFFRDPCILTR
jgi:hypothetical protein